MTRGEVINRRASTGSQLVTARTDEEIDELPNYALEQVDEALITEAKAMWEKE